MDKTINIRFVDDILSPFFGLADGPEESLSFAHINCNSKAEVTEMLQRLIKPHFENKKDIIIEKSKLALSYALTTNNINFSGIFDSCLFPFSPPQNPRDFFVWLWEVLFGNEPCILLNPEEYTIIDDVDETWKIYAP